jgi:hypothetical protein
MGEREKSGNVTMERERPRPRFSHDRWSGQSKCRKKLSADKKKGIKAGDPAP